MSYTERALVPLTDFRVKKPDSLYALERPTWADYEPNFINVFGLAQDSNMNPRRGILSPEGSVVARVYDDQEVFGFKRLKKGIPSNRAVLPILVTNPDWLAESHEIAGYRRGLTVLDDSAFAVRITSGGRFAVRPVISELQKMFVENFQQIMNYYGY